MTFAGVPMWVLYDHPLDDPAHYVARLWIVVARAPFATDHTARFTHLADAREYLASLGLVRLDRMPEDDAKIVETWL